MRRIEWALRDFFCEAGRRITGAWLVLRGHPLAYRLAVIGGELTVFEGRAIDCVVIDEDGAELWFDGYPDVRGVIELPTDDESLG